MSLTFTLIGQMITFLILWFIVAKYIWPIFNASLEDRQQKIAQGMNLADQAKHTIKEAETKSEKMLADAKAQAADILAQAQKQADILIDEAKEEGRHAGRKELEIARTEITQEQNKAREMLRKELAKLVVDGARQIVSREVKKQDHDEMIKELTKQL